MGESPEQKFDRISRAVQDSILQNYPNPERRGCPGDDVVRDVAGRTDLKADELWEHITHCSPCYRVFLACKQEFRGKKTIRRRAAVGLLAAAVATIPILVITRSRPAKHDVQVGDWNLETSALRGVDSGPDTVSQQRASRSRGFIRVHLPLGSEDGEYQMQIRKTEDGSALQATKGKAEIINGHTVVSFPVDFSSLSPGAYIAAIGRGTRRWRVYPLLLS